MVPARFLDFLIASCGAAGAMIGLLFVAVSLRTDMVFGPNSTPRVRALAGASFTGLVNAFSLSLLGLIPRMNVGVSVTILAAVCLINTWRLHRNFSGETVQYSILILSCLNYLVQTMGGIVLIVHPHSVWVINGLCYIIFASFTIALVRAWDLMKAQATASP
jgi:hypothetical protein